MCGITAYYGNEDAAPLIYNSLKRLDYRGYDSAGIATSSASRLQVKRDVGKVNEIHERHDLEDMEGMMGIGHTRWATHGDVSQRNAHPHTCCKDRFVIVHNGIIENWQDIKKELKGHKFTSDTDSEVVAHYIEERTKEVDVEKAVQSFLADAEGSFAVALMDTEKDVMFTIKNGSPLALGIGENEVYVGSDIYAFSPYTNKTVFMGDNEYAVIEDNDFLVKNEEGKVLEKNVKNVDWDQEQSKKGDHEHHMISEIREIPKSLEKLDNSLQTVQKKRLERFAEKLEDKEKVIFTAAGTSYHASLLGVYFLQKAGIDAQTLIASEFENYERVDEDTLLVAISQSGETKDVLDAMEYSEERGAEITSITNVPHSTVERKSDINLRIKAGQEVCVAATKTFTNQLFTLLKVVEELNGDLKEKNISEGIRKVIEENEDRIKEISNYLKDKEDIYVIGKGETYPVAREIALKLKEIAYIHAEGMMGGELKHGTLALIEEGTPVISLIPEEDSEIVSNVKEVESRGARSIRISPHSGQFKIPPKTNGEFTFYSTVIGFLLTYWTAKEKDLPIDKPRNLAKSVTVK